ncbi:hypothetical protein [Dactylosporangium sp. CA-233914]|uniref:hypothetical protein n=1 Tax=Dactylosporangium sp. CA-233914 TaxID=3239934 RepID=UPI003D8D5D6D
MTDDLTSLLNQFAAAMRKAFAQSDSKGFVRKLQEWAKNRRLLKARRELPFTFENYPMFNSDTDGHKSPNGGPKDDTVDQPRSFIIIKLGDILGREGDIQPNRNVSRIANSTPKQMSC